MVLTTIAALTLWVVGLVVIAPLLHQLWGKDDEDSFFLTAMIVATVMAGIIALMF